MLDHRGGAARSKATPLLLALLEHRNVDRPLARPVELAKEDPLPGPERELALPAQRHYDARPHQRRTNVGRSILFARLMVLPWPAVLDHALERRFVVARDRRIRVLVDRDSGRRVRHVHEDRGSVLAGHGLAYLARDVDELAPSLGAKPNLVHDL